MISQSLQEACLIEQFWRVLAGKYKLLSPLSPSSLPSTPSLCCFFTVIAYLSTVLSEIRNFGIRKICLLILLCCVCVSVCVHGLCLWYVSGGMCVCLVACVCVSGGMCVCVWWSVCVCEVGCEGL